MTLDEGSSETTYSKETQSKLYICSNGNAEFSLSLGIYIYTSHIFYLPYLISLSTPGKGSSFCLMCVQCLAPWGPDPWLSPVSTPVICINNNTQDTSWPQSWFADECSGGSLCNTEVQPALGLNMVAVLCQLTAVHSLGIQRGSKVIP